MGNVKIGWQVRLLCPGQGLPLPLIGYTFFIRTSKF